MMKYMYYGNNNTVLDRGEIKISYRYCTCIDYTTR